MLLRHRSPVCRTPPPLRRRPAGALLNDTTGFAEISHFSSSSPSSPSFSFIVTPQTSPPTRDWKEIIGISLFSVQIKTVLVRSSVRTALLLHSLKRQEDLVETK